MISRSEERPTEDLNLEWKRSCSILMMYSWLCGMLKIKLCREMQKNSLGSEWGEQLSDDILLAQLGLYVVKREIAQAREADLSKY